MRRHVLIAGAILALGLGTARSAHAHALLRHADPAVGGTVPTAPGELALTFSEAVEPAFCRVSVTNAAGASMTSAAPHADPRDASRLLVPLKALPPGEYTVTWHAVSADTHKTQGRFRFTVAP